MAKSLGLQSIPTLNPDEDVDETSRFDKAILRVLNNNFRLLSSALSISDNRVFLGTGTGWTAIASPNWNPITGTEITLPAGRWLVQGIAVFACSSGSPRVFNVRIRNTTDGIDLTTQGAGYPAITDTRPKVVTADTFNNSSGKVLRIEANVSALDGTQVHHYSRLWAKAASDIL